MKAAFVTKYGGPEVLEIRNTPIPTPAQNQILVRVRAIGLNFADVVGRFGVYPGTPKPPFILGLEFSGDVVAVGPEVKTLKGRERVMGYSRLGSHAEYVTVSENLATALPASMTYEEGASFLVTYLSAYHGIVRLANIRKGEKLLVHAAAGGVGMSTVQLAKHLGAEIFATAGTDEKVALVKQQGAHHVINYRTTEFASEVRRISNGHGVDVVMDSVGGVIFKKSWKLLAQMGRYILYGISAVTGKGALNPMKVAATYSLMKPIFPPSLLGANKGIFGFNLGKVFPFNQIVEAHRVLQTRQSVGKVVVVVGE
jgi:NADPH:quinone reductase-like Zn-dependent oxidoreductase